MSDISAEAQQKVLELRKAYIESFSEKIIQLEACWHKLEASSFAVNELDALCLLCHKLAGSSGSFAMPEVAQAALNLEQLCRQAIMLNSGMNELRNNLDSGFKALIQLLEHGYSRSNQ
jgi:HPt (histidine-containing phosphotransfer) domain-containing protein